MSPSSPPTRRERLRQQTLDEIKEHALAQVAEGGPTALSLNAVARAMGMSGPAIYRYFASRDDLLTALVADSYDALADTLDAAAAGARRRAPEGRLRAVAGAYRDWAVAHPHRYRLAFSTAPAGSDLVDFDATITSVSRSMLTLLRGLADVGGPVVAPPRRSALDRDLRGWAAQRPGPEEHPTQILGLGVIAWTRMHGIVSLEINSVFEAMGIDAALLFDAELDQLIAQRVALGAP